MKRITTTERKNLQERMRELIRDAKNRMYWENVDLLNEVRDDFHEYLYGRRNTVNDIVYFPNTDEFHIVCLRKKDDSDYMHFKFRNDWWLARKRYYNGIEVWTAF